MKNTKSKSKMLQADDLRPEYQFDYSKARPNRFAGRIVPGQITVILDSDVSEVFPTSESVNNALRALLTLMSEVKRKPSSS